MRHARCRSGSLIGVVARSECINCCATVSAVELSERDPQLVVRLHERVARWYESVGQFDRAVEHQLRTHNPERVDQIIWRAAAMFVATGRTATVQRWLDTFTAEELAVLGLRSPSPGLGVPSPKAIWRPSAIGHPPPAI